MGFGIIGVDLAHLGHRHAQKLGELDGLGDRFGLIDFIADDHHRHARFDQKLRGPRDLVGVGPHAHARIELRLRDDLGPRAIVVVVGMPGDVGGSERRGPGRLEGAPHGLGNHVRPAGEPGVLGDRLGKLLLVRHFLKAVAAGAARLVGAVGIDDERRLLLPGIEDLAHGIDHTDDAGLHHDGGLARRLDVTGCHGSARPFVGREDVFELRPVDERLVELGVFARGIAEHVFHAAGDQLLGERGAAGALELLHACDGRRPRRRGCVVVVRHVRHRGRRIRLGEDGCRDRAEHGLGGRRGEACLGEPVDKAST